MGHSKQPPYNILKLLRNTLVVYPTLLLKLNLKSLPMVEIRFQTLVGQGPEGQPAVLRLEYRR